jgi:hypothetical protein
LRPIDRRAGGIIRAVVGLGKRIELLRCLEEVIAHRRMKAPTLLAVARHRGTDSSTSGESGANLSSSPWRAAPAHGTSGPGILSDPPPSSPPARSLVRT